MHLRTVPLAAGKQVYVSTEPCAPSGGRVPLRVCPGFTCVWLSGPLQPRREQSDRCHCSAETRGLVTATTVALKLQGGHPRNLL